MKETREILNAVSNLKDGEQGVLATVIDVRGSGYRLPGARMIMLASGETMGTVSGGCLESDVLERARKVLTTGRAEVFTYDTTGDENSVFSMNMGCRGIIRILLEAVDRESELITRLRLSYEGNEPQIIATLLSADNGSVGARAYLNGAGEIEGSGLPNYLEQHPDLDRTIREFALSNSAYAFTTLLTDQGAFEFALERLEPPILLLLFGAGADAIPMASIVSELGWHIIVHDHRPTYLTRERFPQANEMVLQASDANVDLPPLNRRTAAVIMTHNYARDREILPAVLNSNAFYVGALGPKRRTEQLLEELTRMGISFTGEQLARLYAPIGLDTGADSPESIALSIIGEIQTVIANRSGGHLRDREGTYL